MWTMQTMLRDSIRPRMIYIMLYICDADGGPRDTTLAIWTYSCRLLIVAYCTAVLCVG